MPKNELLDQGLRPLSSNSVADAKHDTSVLPYFCSTGLPLCLLKAAEAAQSVRERG